MALSEISAPTATCTLLAKDRATGHLGIATASRCLAAGAKIPFLRPGVGAVATQYLHDPRIAFAILDDLTSGVAPQDSLERALKFFGQAEQRQVGVLLFAPQAGQVGYVAHSGQDCAPWCGQRLSENLIVLGNSLKDAGVLEEADRAFRASQSPHLAERLLDGLLAGELAGGRQDEELSACLQVVGAQPFQPPLLSLRVDHHPDAAAELHRIWILHHREGQAPVFA